VVQAAARDGEEPAAQLATLEQLHASLLIFCAARSDVFGLLSLPGHFRERSARQMRDRLVSSPSLAGEERTLSFGALYHPWIVARDGDLRTLPPDGAAAGIMAGRALAGGAWLAPANRVFAGALAVEPNGIDPALRYGERFNVVEQTPSGFLVLNSDTLSTDSELRTIGTRRLIILLRRLALREGNRLVFEPNDARLARRIERQFEEVMTFLYARRAFIGATHEQAFRVIVRASADDRDNGRLFIELRFAPAEPMVFLTVRMVEAGGTWVVMEGN
jgi:phage tail sheath protein FI